MLNIDTIIVQMYYEFMTNNEWRNTIASIRSKRMVWK